MKQEHGLSPKLEKQIEETSNRLVSAGATICTHLLNGIGNGTGRMLTFARVCMDRHVRAKALDNAVSLANADRRYGIQAWPEADIIDQARRFENFIHTGKVENDAEV